MTKKFPGRKVLLLPHSVHISHEAWLWLREQKDRAILREEKFSMSATVDALIKKEMGRDA